MKITSMKWISIATTLLFAVACTDVNESVQPTTSDTDFSNFSQHVKLGDAYADIIDSDNSGANYAAQLELTTDGFEGQINYPASFQYNGYVFVDDGTGLDKVANDHIYTSSAPIHTNSTAYNAGTRQSLLVNNGSVSEEGITVGCSIEYVEEGGTSENCGGTCDDLLDLGCVCFYDCYAEVSLF